MHFGCVEVVKQHDSTRSTRLARQVELVVSCRDVTWRAKWNLGFAWNRTFCCVAAARVGRTRNYETGSEKTRLSSNTLLTGHTIYLHVKTDQRKLFLTRVAVVGCRGVTDHSATTWWGLWQYFKMTFIHGVTVTSFCRRQSPPPCWRYAILQQCSVPNLSVCL